MDIIMEGITRYYVLDHVKFEPQENYLLLRLDHIGLYYPKIYFYKFEYLKNLLEIEFPMEIESSMNVQIIDVTKRFIELADLNILRINFLGVLFDKILKNEEYDIKNYKYYYEPLIKFFDFLGLDKRIMKLII